MLSLGFFGFLDSLTTAPHGSNGASLGPCWCRSSTWPAKSHTGSHRAEFGFCACLLALLRRITSLSAIPYKNSGRRKKYLCPIFLKWNQLSSSSRASVFQNRREKIPFLCLCSADFALPEAGPMTYAPRYFRTQTANPACPGPGSKLSPQSLVGTAHPTLSCSNLYATASWIGRIVYRSTPFCTLPSLPWTVVFSVSMSLFSSNR